MERIDRDEDVAHVGVNLVPAVATLELLRHLVLEKMTKKSFFSRTQKLLSWWEH